MDKEVLAGLSGPANLRPSPDCVARPVEPYQLQTKEYWRYMYSPSGNATRSKGGEEVVFKLSPDGGYLEATFDKRDDTFRSHGPPLQKSLQRFINARPVQHVRITGTLDATELVPFLQIKSLRRLSLGEANVAGDKQAVLKTRDDVVVD